MGKNKNAEEVLYFCDGKKCCRYNEEAKSCFETLLKENGLKEAVSFEKMKCQGMCKSAPVFYLDSHKKYKKEVDKKKAQKIFEKYIA